MSMVATDLKDLFKLKIKARHDSYTDQYSRIFMVKLLLACTIVTGISWYSDKFNCIMPETQASYEDFPKFVGTTCWIQGVYIYKELHDKLDQLAYYGIPRDMDSDGLVDNQYSCRVKDKFHNFNNKACKEMTKKFFTQYQYMPFLICSLALLYYVPYMFYKTVNHDLINLRTEIKKDRPDIDGIVKSYFQERRRSGRPTRLTVRQLINILVKCGYIAVNFLAFFGMDSLLEGEYYSYGTKWIKWSKENNTMAYDYMGKRTFPKPGNEMLPPFGYCELYSQSRDVKTAFADKHKVVCELSQHILYQYVFVVLWFAIVFGIIFSILGLVILLINYLIGIIGLKKLQSSNNSAKNIFERLTYREIEYLEFLKKKNIPVYGDVLEKLRERLLGSPAESIGSSYDAPPKSAEPPTYQKQRNDGPYAL